MSDEQVGTTMLRIFGRVHALTPLPVLSENAEATARKHLFERGIAAIEPVTVNREGDSWVVFTNASRKGGNHTVVIDGYTGAVRSTGHLSM